MTNVLDNIMDSVRAKKIKNAPLPAIDVFLETTIEVKHGKDIVFKVLH